MSQAQSILSENSKNNSDLTEYARYAEGYPYVDDFLKKLLVELKHRVVNEEDDAIILISGQVDSGKSTLAHHLHTLWTVGEPSVNNIALDKQGFGKALWTSMTQPELRMRVCHYDEADVSKRDALSKYNKRVIHLYDAIRGKQGFHLWCNPSADYLDKKFVQERVKALIYTFRKPRGRYLLFLRKKLLSMQEKFGNIKQGTLESYGTRYASNPFKKSMFTAYPECPFLSEYMCLKSDRMDSILESFKNDFASEEVATYTLSDLTKAFKMTWPTLQKYTEMALRDGIIFEDEVKSPTGRWAFKKESAEALKQFIKDNRGLK